MLQLFQQFSPLLPRQSDVGSGTGPETTEGHPNTQNSASEECSHEQLTEILEPEVASAGKRQLATV